MDDHKEKQFLEESDLALQKVRTKYITNVNGKEAKRKFSHYRHLPMVLKEEVLARVDKLVKKKFWFYQLFRIASLVPPVMKASQ
ncbi:hypothetical protein T11_8578 [Trichinella zimbabwensis]|uniref:Uncharacterized protein n=1 Tax=Trichinella zimbabwensis TaxID=268475 RepID=A0A0V1HKS0_9BILA|nr:hypothetical protein T11_8578 [Trichinella zimbabwensis]